VKELGGKESSGWVKSLRVLVLAAYVSLNLLVFGCVSFFPETKRNNIKLAIWQRNIFYRETADDRTKVILLFRNRSRRPIEVVEIFLRAGEKVLGGNGYRERIKLPLQVDPRGFRHVEFRIENDDGKRMTNILIRDIKNNEFVIEAGPGRMWIQANPGMEEAIIAAGW